MLRGFNKDTQDVQDRGERVDWQALSSDMRVMLAWRMRFSILPIPVNHRRTTKSCVTHIP